MNLSMIQPANKEKIELLGEWLRYTMHQNDCEDYDGRFADVVSAFVLHSIAFLEIVRQVLNMYLFATSERSFFH